MNKNGKIALMISVTVMQTIGLILSFIPEWCANWKGNNTYYNLYNGSSIFIVGIIYAICAIAILILLWTNFEKINFFVSIGQTILIIVNHIIVDSYWEVLELGIGHTLLICVSCIIVAILYFVKEKK